VTAFWPNVRSMSRWPPRANAGTASQQVCIKALHEKQRRLSSICQSVEITDRAPARRNALKGSDAFLSLEGSDSGVALKELRESASGVAAQSRMPANPSSPASYRSIVRAARSEMWDQQTREQQVDDSIFS
jgi:hypothetical protein